MRESNPVNPAAWLHAWREAVDPFGMLDACQRVQRAWLQSPERLGQQLTELAHDGTTVQVHAMRRYLGDSEQDLVSVNPFDERFKDPAWETNPFFDQLKEFYLLGTRWLEDAVEATPGVDEETRAKAAFLTRQLLNAVAPSNQVWSNPAVMLRAMQTGGMSLAEGMANLVKDMHRGSIRMTDEEAFTVGENLATTPGKVVFRNHLLEVIQYAATTEKVHAMPVVLVSPWINKYYILDLNPRKSLVRWLVERGYTVFVTSWKNPGPELADTAFDDYLTDGALQAVEVAREVTGSDQVHLTGYCIGGTLVACLMAWLNRAGGRRKSPVAHWTLLTTLVDFEMPGEIGVFIDDDTVEWLERRMARTGYLDGQDMANAFRALRSNSLVWYYYVHNYLLGEDLPRFDVLFWNMDTTRMPERMHAWYLREFYLENRLVQPDAVTLAGRKIDLGRIKQPLYAVGAEQDHIAPWKATFRIGEYVSGPVRYILATSGHILGIINPPVDPPKRRYWKGEIGDRTDPEAWLAEMPKVSGSWWEDWDAWLDKRCGAMVDPPALGSDTHPPLADAPGTYVLER
ncbi:MAG: class I poly(R)-hydroxyalkanoic acid synthase [Gammaproteobacteria bacterium]|nr:class I poly(R)-hydroxyalkanoic acid synthase [Gammaproteobacteria bacterium]